MLTEPSSESLEQPVATDVFRNEPAIAFVCDEQPLGSFVMMTPSAVGRLVDNHVHVFMQHGFSGKSQFSDMDYANVGVEFVDDFFQLAQLARTLVKFQPFSEEQVSLSNNRQILFSTQIFAQLSFSYLQLLQQNSISAVALNLIRNASGDFVMDRILTEPLSPMGVSIALSNFLHPLLMSFVCSPRLRFALQRNLQLMEAAYCFEGKICNRDLASMFQMPFHDIVSLCWDLN